MGIRPQRTSAPALRYAGFAARLLTETDEAEISKIKAAMKEIRDSLGLTHDEIVNKASSVTVRE